MTTIKYSREVLLDINETVKGRPFKGEILYPSVLKTFVDARVTLRPSRNTNGHPNRYPPMNGHHGYMIQPPPHLFNPALLWWMPRPPFNPGHPPYNRQHRNESFPPALRISREPRSPELRKHGYSYPPVADENDMQSTKTSAASRVQEQKLLREKMQNRPPINLQELQNLNSQRSIVKLKVIKS